MNIRDAIKELAKSNNEMYCKVCTVDAVDLEARTIDVSPLDDSAPILEVSLQANQVCKNGVVLFPKIGSHVVVAFITNAVAIAVLFEEVEKLAGIIGDKKPIEITAEDNVLKITVNGTTIEVTGEKKITFNGGDNGGLLISQNTAEKLSAIENDVNALKQVLSTWSPVPNDGGAALKGLVASWSARALTITKKTDIESNDIKH